VAEYRAVIVNSLEGLDLPSRPRERPAQKAIRGPLDLPETIAYVADLYPRTKEAADRMLAVVKSTKTLVPVRVTAKKRLDLPIVPGLYESERPGSVLDNSLEIPWLPDLGSLVLSTGLEVKDEPRPAKEKKAGEPACVVGEVLLWRGPKSDPARPIPSELVIERCRERTKPNGNTVPYQEIEVLEYDEEGRLLLHFGGGISLFFWRKTPTGAVISDAEYYGPLGLYSVLFTVSAAAPRVSP
jgi:hypothetical protein